MKFHFVLLALLVSVGFNIYFVADKTGELTQDKKQSSKLTATSFEDESSNTLAAPRVTTSTRNSNGRASADLAFESLNFEDAVSHFADLSEIDENSAQRVLEDWMVIAREWLRNGRMKRAEQFIDSFLNYQPYNLDILQLEAMRLTFINHSSEAISVYQTIIDNSLEPDVQRAMRQQIHSIVNQEHISLQKTGRWQALIDFVEPLIYSEPDYLPYQFIIAEAMVQVKQYDNAKAYLESLLSYDDYVVQAESLLDQISQLELGEQAIELTQVGAHYLVSGRLNAQANTSLMIDTGASLSVITQSRFDQLALWQTPEFIRTADMRTAGGTVNAPIYRFLQFDIGGYTVRNIDFVVMDIENFNHADGLLGMNYLRNFDFQIDQQHHRLLLKYR